MEKETTRVGTGVADTESARIDAVCENKNEQKKKPRRGKIAAVIAACVVILAVLGCAADALGAPMLRYYSGIVKLERGDFAAARTVFERLGDYADAEELAREAEKGLRYLDAAALLEQGHFPEALAIYEELGDFLDSWEKLQAAKYLYAVELLERGDAETAKPLLAQLGNYRDSLALFRQSNNSIQYERGMQSMAQEDYATAAATFQSLGDFRDAREKAEECLTLSTLEEAYKEGSKLYKDDKWAEACRALVPIRDADYKDTTTILDEIHSCAVAYVRTYAQNGEMGKALAFLRILEEIDEPQGAALREELFPEETFVPDQSFYFFDTTHITRFTANTPTEDFASVVLYMLLHGKLDFALMSNKPVDYDILLEKAFHGSNLAQEMLPGYGAIYNPSVSVGENYVTFNLNYEQEYSEHQRTVHLKEFKAFCEDSVRELTEMGLLTSSMSRRQKAEVIINWVGFYLTYDDSLSIHDVGVAVEEKRGVCEAYAALYNRMCNLAGIPTYGQIGEAWSGREWGKHIWSFHVEEDGNIFYADATWADSWDIDFGKGTQEEEPTVELFAEHYLELCVKKALAEQRGSGSAHLQGSHLAMYRCSETIWSSHKAERSAEFVIAYHAKITGNAA